MLAEAPDGREGAFLLEQRFRYDYAAPAHRLRHRLMVVPRAVHGGQQRLDHGISVSGDPVLVSVGTDRFGNHVVDLRASVVSEWVEFAAWALISRLGSPGVTTLRSTATNHRHLLQPTRLTGADEVVAEAARELVAAGPGGLDLAERVCTWANRALTYEYGITGVRTTAAAAVAGGRGVCQDYAHVMLAVCRAAGLSARYVSGHLVGEGGSHAWVEVVVPDPSPAAPRRALAVALDPTHDRRATDDYLTVAVGRDYGDVAPTCGTFDGTGPGVLTAGKRLSIVDAERAPSVAAGSS